MFNDKEKVEEILKRSESMMIYGMPFSEMTREQLITACVLGWEAYYNELMKKNQNLRG